MVEAVGRDLVALLVGDEDVVCGRDADEIIATLSSSGRRDPRELSTVEAKAVLDQLRDLQVFYINIGGGEPMVRRDFFELVEYSVDNGIGVARRIGLRQIGRHVKQRLFLIIKRTRPGFCRFVT